MFILGLCLSLLNTLHIIAKYCKDLSELQRPYDISQRHMCLNLEVLRYLCSSPVLSMACANVETRNCMEKCPSSGFMAAVEFEGCKAACERHLEAAERLVWYLPEISHIPLIIEHDRCTSKNHNM